jgi:hypothetical protein
MVDQDGLSIGLAVLAVLILVSGLRRGAFEIQFIRAARATSPLGYWLVVLVLVGIAIECGRRAIFIGCAEC